MTWYSAGSEYHPGTNLPRSVTGECPHRHRTPEAARRCIEEMDAAIKRGHGRDAYCDRIVMVEDCGGGRHPLLTPCDSCGTLEVDLPGYLYEDF